MDNLTANKSHIPCQSWAGQNDWPTTSTQVPLLNPLSSSQHLSLGSSPDQRPSYDRLQESNQNCMSDLSTLSSRNSHHSALYKASHMSSNMPSNMLFANNSTPSASHIISFAQQTPHTSSVLLSANQGKNIPPPPLPQTNQPPQLCRTQHLPLLPPHNQYKAPFQPPLSNQSLPNELPISLQSCGQRVSTSQATFEGAYVAFTGIAGYSHSRSSSTPQEQSQWRLSSHSRGAVNESVPDTDDHPQNKPSQKGKTSSPDNSERQRLVILHQRAQLLQQVEELDKLLESIPPEDCSDEKTLHTALQNKTSDAQQVQLSAAKSKHLPLDCASPASCDKQSEACDTPDDPMSAAESEKEANASAESEDDRDPDYLPNSDGDFSDLPSDHDRRSWDKSRLRSPSTSTEEKPPVPKEKRAKSASVLTKDKCVGPVKQICATSKKRFSETVVLPCSNSKTQRVYDRRNYCLYCSNPVSKMARHLERIHSDKPEVAAAFQYPKNSRERQKIWNRLINQGNFAHNKDVLKKGKGQLAVRKRPSKTQKAQDFLHCLYCHGLFVKKALHRHMRWCPEKAEHENVFEIGRKRVALRCVLQTLGDLGISDGFKEVLSQMTYNDVTEAILGDEVILQFGELLFSQQGSDPKTHDYIRQNLRQLARLVLEAQKTTPMEKLADFFLPSNFPHVVSAVNVLAGYNAENESYSIPSLAIKLGYHLQKACSIVEGNAMKCGDENLAESARNFLSVYQKQWNKLISAGALTTLRKTKQKTEKKVPFPQDVKRLNFHMESVHHYAEKTLRDNPTPENYAALAKVILARTVFFNRRSVGEVSTMQLAAFMSRKKSNVHDGMDVSVSDLEKNMCVFFTRVDIRGKCGRTVPVLLKPSFVSAMELLVKVRDICGVPSQNPFLFGRPYALSAYSGSEAIQKYVKECGAKDPKALKSAKIRKHYGTMLQLMNLDEHEADQIFGPNQVRRLRQDSNTQLGDVEMEADESGQQCASWEHNDLSGACYGQADLYNGQAHGASSGSMTVAPKSGKKGSKSKGKHKWEEAEVLAVERHLMALIEGHKVPQKNDCIQCLEAEPQALRTRSWKGVKDYVRNRITALKRQSKTFQATSSNSNWPGPVGSQQSTGHF